LIATERKRVMNSTNKTKEIMLLHYASEKQRLKAQKDLEKRQQMAQTNANRIMDMKKDKIKKHLEKTEFRIERMQNNSK
jgi:uncharacterized protein YaeQ